MKVSVCSITIRSICLIFWLGQQARQRGQRTWIALAEIVGGQVGPENGGERQEEVPQGRPCAKGGQTRGSMLGSIADDALPPLRSLAFEMLAANDIGERPPTT